MNTTNPQVTATPIVSILNGVPTTTSLAIADGSKNPHKSVIQLIRKYQPDLEEFGSLAFEMRVIRQDGRGGEQAEIAILNERQATLILTYMRNTFVIREFKKQLVKAFYQLAETAKQPDSSTQPAPLAEAAKQPTKSPVASLPPAKKSPPKDDINPHLQSLFALMESVTKKEPSESDIIIRGLTTTIIHLSSTIDMLTKRLGA